MRWALALHAALLCAGAGAAELGAPRAAQRHAASGANRIVSDAAAATAAAARSGLAYPAAAAALRDASELAAAPAPAEARAQRAAPRARASVCAALACTLVPCMRGYMRTPSSHASAPARPPRASCACRAFAGGG
jgi:hypothetical protein